MKLSRTRFRWASSKEARQAGNLTNGAFAAGLALEKLNTEMGAQKAACHKALDERERMVDTVKHMHEESARDEKDFHDQVRAPALSCAASPPVA